jgi:uncharacterized protein
VSDELIEALAEAGPRRARALAAKMASRDKQGLLPAMHALYAGDRTLAEKLLPPDDALRVGEAAAFGREARLRELLQSDPKLARSWSGDGFTPLHLALFSGEESAVRLLIEHGADLEAPSRHRTIRGVRPLHTAAFVRERDLAAILLDAGAEVDSRADGGFTALHSAAEHGDEGFARLLLERGADPAAQDDRGRTPAACAADGGFEDLAKLLS